MASIELPVPTLGERGDINDREMPTSALRICENMMRDDKGWLSSRSGYAPLSETNPDSRVLGIHWFRDASTAALRVVAGTKTGIWKYASGAWTDITGSALTGLDNSHVRFTTFFQGGVYNMVAVNGVDVPKKWDGSAATYSNLGGTPGVSIDVTALANRLVLLQSPNKIRISDFNNYESFVADILLIDSGDLMIGAQRINRTSVGVIGERSQWVLRSQSGSVPVRVERISEQPGAVSRAAIVKANSTLYYLADDFNIYKFDGATPAQAVGWAMRAYVRENINQDEMDLAHGAYFEEIHKIFWFFPSRGETLPKIGIFLDILTGEMGRLMYPLGVTASSQVRASSVSTLTWADLSGYTWDNVSVDYPTWDSFGESIDNFRMNVLGDSSGVIHGVGLGDGSDNGSPISCTFEFPLKDYGGFERNVVPKVYEAFFRQAPVSTTVQPYLGTSETLMVDPTYSALAPFDLATDQRNDVDLSEQGEHRFVSLKHIISAPNGGVHFLGGLFQGEATDLVVGPENQ